MKKVLTCITSAILLQTGVANAGPRHIQVSQKDMPSGISAERVNHKIRQLESTIYRSDGLAKTTATTRLSTVTIYDYTMPVGNQVLDSLKLISSHGRGSAFNYLNLDYDIYNGQDFPYPLNFGSPYVNYDTMRDLLNSGQPTDIRTYNAANKIARDESPSLICTFSYDGSNRLTKITFIQKNNTTGNWDSVYRDFYRYDASGYLTLDSGEYWDIMTMAWLPDVNVESTNDGSGRPIQSNFVGQGGSSGPITFLQFHISYAGTSVFPTRLIVRFINQTTMVLEDVYKDTLGYTNGSLTYHNGYDWNDTTLSWDLAGEERRHLNAASLPDSIWYRNLEFRRPTDSGYSLLAYNGQNDPVSRIDHSASSLVNPQSASYWGYEAVESAGVAILKAEPLEFYPNPVTDRLLLKGVEKGSYLIYNTSGQLVQAGDIQSAMIPTDLLSPGIYIINVKDKSGKTFRGNITRR